LLAVELSFEKGHFIERRFILVAIVAWRSARRRWLSLSLSFSQVYVSLVYSYWSRSCANCNYARGGRWHPVASKDRIRTRKRARGFARCISQFHQNARAKVITASAHDLRIFYSQQEMRYRKKEIRSPSAVCWRVAWSDTDVNIESLTAPSMIWRFRWVWRARWRTFPKR
jgi:hypothetical protein